MPVEQGRYLRPLAEGAVITGDCDDDTLLIQVVQTGNACHTGSHSCFFNTIWEDKQS